MKFVDETRNEHHAIVTAVHAPTSINLVYVTGDPAKTDQYGRQIERRTSVVHEDLQGATGMFWKFED